MSDFGTLEHSIRAWLENDYPLYREVQRIAARDNRHHVRTRDVQRLVTSILYGLNGMSDLRHLYRKAAEEKNREPRSPDWAALGKFRDSFTRTEFDHIDWAPLTYDLMEGM